MGVGFGGAVKLTGESEYKKALQNINRALKETSSELKSVSAAYSRNSSDTDNLTNKKKALNSLLEQEKTKLNVLLDEYKKMSAQYTENKRKHEELGKALDAETSKLKELEKTAGVASEEYKTQSKLVGDLAKEYQTSEKNIEQNESAMSKMRIEINNTNTSLNETAKELEDTGAKADEAANGGWTIFKSVLADLATDVIRSAIDGLKQLGAAAIDLGKDAIASYADYEQLVGGVETLFGTGGLSAEEFAEKIGVAVEDVDYYMAMYERANEKVLANAAEAYRTTGLSANEYMETVTSFSASLISSVGGNTELAASLADQALRDMSDNANKMGTDIDSLTTAWASFARGQYTLLDNLKLGYGGSKEEAQRLIEDASKISGIEYNLDNLADFYQAIHVIQEEMGITGTTSEEAEKTISGSTRMMAASWQNLLTGIADDQSDFQGLVNNFIDSVLTASDNILPRVETTIEGLGELAASLIDELLPKLIDKLPPLVENLAPKLVSSTEKILSSLGAVLPKLLPVVGQTLRDLLSLILKSLPDVLKLGSELLMSLISGIAEAIPELIEMLPDIIKAITDTLLSPESIDFLLNTGLDLLLAVTQGIMDALPELIAIVPDIINALTSTLLDPKNVVKIVETAGALVVALAKGIVESVIAIKDAAVEIIEGLNSKWKEYLQGFKDWGQEFMTWLAEGIISLKETIKVKAGEIVGAIKDKIKNSIDSIKDIGRNIIEGLWNGIADKVAWLKVKCEEIGDTILNGLKDFFGIASPSKLMRDSVGRYIAEGIGVGFSDEMKNVSQEMQDALPTSFDIETNVESSRSGANATYSLNDLVSALKLALESVDVVMDDVRMGKFVNKTVTQAIYQ